MRTILVLAAAVVALACATAASARAGTGTSPVRVVAAENVYGDIVRQIGGDHVAVTSVLTDPNADPHLFQPGTSTGLAVARARLVIQNGLGYDAFMEKLENAAPNGGRLVVSIDAVLDIHGSGANPHLWYDVPGLGRIADAIAGALERVDSRNTPAYRTGLARFDASLAPLRAEVARIRSRFAGRAVAYTEPVPGYLLAAAGLRNVAPSSFTRAIEEGTDPPPSAVAQMLSLLSHRKIAVLLFNRQAVTPLTKQLASAAAKARIPVVPVTETLPPGQTFQRWQLAQAKALAAALAP